MDEVQQAFNDAIGAVLTFCDEAEVGFAVKKAVKSTLWELCDKQIKPIIAELDTEDRFGYGSTWNR